MDLEIRQKAENRSKRLVRQKYIKLANLWTLKIFRDREIWGERVSFYGLCPHFGTGQILNACSIKGRYDQKFAF